MDPTLLPDEETTLIPAAKAGTLGRFERIIAATSGDELAADMIDGWTTTASVAVRNLERVLRSPDDEFHRREGISRLRHALTRFRDRISRVTLEDFGGAEAFGDYLRTEGQRLFQLREQLLQEANREADLLEARAGHTLRTSLRLFQKACADTGLERLETYRELRRTMEDLTGDASGRHSSAAWLLRGWICWRIGDRPREPEETLRRAMGTSHRCGATASIIARELLAEIHHGHMELENALAALKGRDGNVVSMLNPIRALEILADAQRWEEARALVDLTNLFGAVQVLAADSLAPLHSMALHKLIEMETTLHAAAVEAEMQRASMVDRALLAEEVLEGMDLVENGELQKSQGVPAEMDVFALANQVYLSKQRSGANEAHWRRRIDGAKKRTVELIEAIEERLSKAESDRKARGANAQTFLDNTLAVARKEMDKAVKEAERAGMAMGITVGLSGLGICGFLWLAGRRGGEVGGTNPFTLLGWALVLLPVVVAVVSQMSSMGRKKELDNAFKAKAARAEEQFRKHTKETDDWFDNHRDAHEAERAKLEDRLERLNQAFELLGKSG